MAALRHGVRTGLQQAKQFAARSRRQSLADPSRGLFKTHQFAVAVATIDPDVYFPTRTHPITFAIDVVRTAGTSNGVLFELGGTARGVAAAIDDEDLVFAAGTNLAEDTDLGADATVTGLLLGQNKRYSLVFGINPGAGAINVWANGKLVAAALSVNGTFGGEWCDDDLGDIGDESGDLNDRITAGFQGTLTGASIVSPLRAYHKQIPRQFQNLGLGTNGGNGSWSVAF